MSAPVCEEEGERSASQASRAHHVLKVDEGVAARQVEPASVHFLASNEIPTSPGSQDPVGEP